MAKQHGLLIDQISRRPHNFGENRMYARSDSEGERNEAYMRGSVITENIFTLVEFRLTEDEIEDFNTLEARIAARLANEIATKGK